MKLRITDPGLRASILIHIIEKIDRNELDSLLNSGVSPEFLDQLRQINIPSLIRLVNLGCPEITFGIGEDSLRTGMDTLQRQNTETEDLIYFIQNGASQSMIEHLFRMNATVIHSYRKLLTNDRKSGRTTLPDEKVRDEIQLHWHSLQNVEGFTITETIRKKIRLLHGQFDLPLDILYTTINEFKNEFKDVLQKRRPACPQK
jgi:hypothetical protein